MIPSIPSTPITNLKVSNDNWIHLKCIIFYTSFYTKKIIHILINNNYTYISIQVLAVFIGT